MPLRHLPVSPAVATAPAPAPATATATATATVKGTAVATAVRVRGGGWRALQAMALGPGLALGLALGLGMHATAQAGPQPLPPAWDAALRERDAAALAQLTRAAGGRLPVDGLGVSALEAAIRTSPMADAERLTRAMVDAGADVQQRGASGRTALHMAAAVGCVGCVAELLRAGLPATVQRQDGGTPLHRSRAAVRPLLLAAGADASARDAQGRVPLHVSTEPDESLLAPGVDVRDRWGMTPLHVAALAGSEDDIAWLLAHGADPAARTTARYEHREGVLAAEFDPVIPFEAGQRPLDLVAWQHDRTKWATGRYERAWRLLDAATPNPVLHGLRRWLGAGQGERRD